VLAASAIGISVIRGTQRLKNKESDRLMSSMAMLSSLGVLFEIGTNEIRITGGIKSTDVCIETYNDHRMVLAAIVASKISSLNVSLNEMDSVAKSFPEMKLYL
jgi:3-phosphoshikimate 1-carboxyvinyltransferase